MHVIGETVIPVTAMVLLLGGTLFFTAGTVGLIRFPDVRSRLHALAKADTLGLGLVLLGAGLLLGSWSAAVVLLLTWLLALGAASTSAHVLARLEAEGEDAGEDRGGAR